MNILAGGLAIELKLRYIESFKNISLFETLETPFFHLISCLSLPSFSKKRLIDKTEYFELYETEIGNLQLQYANEQLIGSILYQEKTILISMNLECFQTEYLLSQYAFVYWIKNYTNSIYIHSSSVCYENAGILFCAKSGVGKSTQRRLWETYGKAICINDDKNVLDFTGKDIQLMPNPWAGKHFKCFNKTTPLKAIIFLTRGVENKVEDLSLKKAFPLLLGQLQLPTFAGSDAWSESLDILMSLPMVLFHCNMEEDAFHCLEKELRKRGVFNETKE